MECKTCPKCGARFMEGQLYWNSGKEGCPHDLAGLVCNEYADETCINPCRGSTSGQTWESRRGFLDGINYELERQASQKKR